MNSKLDRAIGVICQYLWGLILLFGSVSLLIWVLKMFLSLIGVL